jgi:hypothetical protein
MVTMMTMKSAACFAVVGMTWLGGPSVAAGQVPTVPRARAVAPVPVLPLPPLVAPTAPGLPAIPVPPTPPTPPVQAVVPVPPPSGGFDHDFNVDFAFNHDFDVNFDHDFSFDFDRQKFDLDMRDFELKMKDFEIEMGKLKDLKLDIRPFPKGLALQVPPRPPAPPKPSVVNVRINTPADNLYDSAHQLIDSGRYDRAIDQLNRLIQQFDGKTDAIANRVDAALYWKAYAQLKESTHNEALATLSDLQKRFADSRWLKDARALEVEVKQAAGQRVSPDGQADEELRLLALRGLMQSDPERGLPMIEQLMAGSGSVRLKENALFVLSQSRAPRAREILASVARSSSNPDVQLRAVRYLGTMRTPESRQALDDIYRSSSDATVKRAIISAYVSSEAIDRLTEIARTDKDLQLRRTAIRNMGGVRRANTGEALRSIYQSESNVEVRRDIVNALASQQNAAILVELARAEKNAETKREIVQKLTGMRNNKVATDYMIELLK